MEKFNPFRSVDDIKRICTLVNTQTKLTADYDKMFDHYLCPEGSYGITVTQGRLFAYIKIKSVLPEAIYIQGRKVHTDKEILARVEEVFKALCSRDVFRKRIAKRKDEMSVLYLTGLQQNIMLGKPFTLPVNAARYIMRGIKKGLKPKDNALTYPLIFDHFKIYEADKK